MNVNVTLSGEIGVTVRQQVDISAKLDRVIALLTAVIVKEGRIMASIEEVITATEEQKTVLDSLVTFVQGLKDQISNQVDDLSAAQQAQIDQIFATVQSNTQEAADAMVANTPAAPA